MFEIITYLQFFTFAAGISIALYVFARNPKSTLHGALSLAAFGMAGWNLSVFLIIQELVPADIGTQHAFAWATLITIGFIWFVYQYPEKIAGYKAFTVATLLIGGVFFLVPFHPGFALSAVVPGGYVDVDLHPILYSAWTLFFTGSFLYALVLLIIRIVRSAGVARHRLLQILLGFLLFLIPSQLSNLLLPFLFNDFRWNNLGPLFTVFLIFFLLNAVIQYRLLDIRWIVGRSLFFSALIAASIWIVSAVTFLLLGTIDERLTLIVGALIVVLAYRPMWNFFEMIFDKFVNVGSYDPKRATEDLFTLVRTEGDVEILTKEIYKKLTLYFGASESGLFVFMADTHKTLTLACNGLDELCKRMDKDLLNIATGGRIIERAELEWQLHYGTDQKLQRQYRKWLPILEKNGVEILVPFTVNKRLVALLVFGDRAGGRELRPRDVAFLELVRSGVSPALENAAKFEEIKKLYTQLEQLDKAKSEFISVVSHRFRTPLSAIRWNLEAVLDVSERALKREVRDSLQDTHDRTLFLIDTLDRLFESLAIESGKFVLDISEFNAAKAFVPMTKELMQRCRELGLKCKVDIDPSVMIHGDEKRLTSVCKSFFANALQYTPTGGVVEFRVREEGGHVRISVRDTGIGIPPAAKPKLFEKFYRAKNAVLTYADGQGLGLYFSKKMIDLHHGKIEVDSVVNQGTTFTISLPRRSGSGKTAKKSGKKPVKTVAKKK